MIRSFLPDDDDDGSISHHKVESPKSLQCFHVTFLSPNKIIDCLSVVILNFELYGQIVK